MNDVMTMDETVAFMGKSKPTLRKLSSAGMLRKVKGGYSAADAHSLERQKRTLFTPWNPSDPLYFAVPTTSKGGWDSNLRLSEGNYRALAEVGLGPVPDGCDITGWWPVRDDMLDRLVTERAVILGIVGGYVREAARIRDGYRCMEDVRRRRCAFLIAPLGGDDLEVLRGYVDGPIGHTGMYVTPEAK